MRKLAWSNRVSHSVIPLGDKFKPYEDVGPRLPLRDPYAKPEGTEKARRERVHIERKAGAVRDKSRKALVQSGGYVTSGWAKQTKAGVSHVSRKVANQALRKLVLG